MALRLYKLYQHDARKYPARRVEYYEVRAEPFGSARLNGTDDSQIMQQTRHRTRTMIDRYTRVRQVVRHIAAMKLGL